VSIGCTDQQTSSARASVDIGDGASLELVIKCCYLGDTLSIDEDAAMEAKINLGGLCLCLPIRTSQFL